nr:hypothetical protein [Tanacetum cinerariifolium]
MANLDFCNKHNMVTFLEKSKGSEGFHEILDFLNSTHIKYALTANPIIYVSLIHQFWETASTSTLEDGKMKITTTIDGRIKTITEASIRRHLKLKDSDGITTLPNTKNFDQLALMGAFKGFNGVDIPLFPTMLISGQIDQGVGLTVPIKSHQTPTNAPSTSQPPISTPSMQPTHNAAKPATMPHDSPLLRVQSLGSVEGGLKLNELTVLCTTLSKKVEDLQSDLQIIKLTYGVAHTKLILRVKKLEHKVKTSQYRRKARVVISDDEEDLEDPSKQGRKIAKIDENPFILLVHDEGTLRIQEDSKIQERTSVDTKILLDQEEPTELVKDLGSGEKGEKKLKSRFDLQQKQFAEEVSEKKDDSSSKSVGGSRKKTIAKKRIGAKLNEESAKRQKLEDVTKEEATAEYEKEKEELRVHTLFMDGTPMEINMLVEKKYHLIKELLEKMLNLQLEAEEESTMAFELIKFIKSLLKE